MAKLQNTVRSNAGIKLSKRRSRSKTRSASPRTSYHASHDFLKQAFTPLLGSEFLSTQNISLTEKSFFKSVAYLCKAYPIEKPNVSSLSFPMNMVNTFGLVKDSIEKVNKDTSVFISGTLKKPVIGVAQTLAMTYDLYYIPLQPVAYLMSQRETWAIANLILSVCSRLHNYGVSLCDHGSFIFYEMEMILENLQQNADEGNEDEYKEEIQKADFIISCSQQLSRKIGSGKTHHALERRLNRIIAHTKWQEKMIAVIKRISDLKDKYPCRRFNDQIRIDWNVNNNDEVIYPDHYLTFYWGGQSSFDDNLAEWINSYLQESTITQSPTFFQIYNTEQNIVEKPFGFEIELLQLISEFNKLLYDYHPY